MTYIAPGIYRNPNDPDFVYEVLPGGGALAYPTRSGSRVQMFTGNAASLPTLTQMQAADIVPQYKPVVSDYIPGKTQTIDAATQRFQSLTGRLPYTNLAGETGAPGSPTTISPSTIRTGNSTLDALLGQLDTYLSELNRRGQIVNPDIELTPERIAEFTRIAENEINPYYATQLGLAREGLFRSIGYSTDEIIKNEQELEQKYGTSVRKLGESSAEQGFAQSGLRQRGEQELALSTQQQIDAARRKLSFETGTLARTFAQQYGSPGTIPTIQTSPQALPGEQTFARSDRTLPLYELSSDVYSSLIGEKEFARRGAVQARTSELEQAQRSLDALKQYRQFMV